ncbi:hypothetical protein IEQ34_004905 [Dendrobium chrysotoxum]|uniref:Protease Do-like 14 n=1 Tax=Dendrobium chrysotoxum TaxID=161865 RepID=A0AAV7H743_DENCH|nr:hypothetical protein IEQ34_004905 [Dendrobium chrysotoxum]
MNLRRAVTPFSLGLFKYKGTWGCTSGSLCRFEPYRFSESSKKEEDKASIIYRRFGPRSDSFIKFPTGNVCPAVVVVSPEKEPGGSGIIIDSNGTVLTLARNIFSLDSRSKINVSLHDRRTFSGTILEVNEDYDLALLKIQSEIPLPTIMFGSLGNYKRRELISIERLFRKKAYPRTSNQNEVDEEDNWMLSGEEFIPRLLYEKFYLGNCGGPIVTLDGELVGISTEIRLLISLHNHGSYGTIDAMGIEEALCSVGYTEKMIRGIINK